MTCSMVALIEESGDISMKRDKLACYRGYIQWRAPLMGYNASTIHRELKTFFGFNIGYTAVKEVVRPLRDERNAKTNVGVQIKDLAVYERIGGYKNE